MSMLDRFRNSNIKEKLASVQKVDFLINKFAKGFTPNRNTGDDTEFNLKEAEARSNPNSPKYTDTARE